MIRRPPRSTLFPTRRSSDLALCESLLPCPANVLRHRAPHLLRRDRRLAGRSEEHTSELQSLAYLVCRLLLEKKKKIWRCARGQAQRVRSIWWAAARGAGVIS